MFKHNKSKIFCICYPRAPETPVHHATLIIPATTDNLQAENQKQVLSSVFSVVGPNKDRFFSSNTTTRKRALSFSDCRTRASILADSTTHLACWIRRAVWPPRCRSPRASMQSHEEFLQVGVPLELSGHVEGASGNYDGPNWSLYRNSPMISRGSSTLHPT